MIDDLRVILHHGPLTASTPEILKLETLDLFDRDSARRESPAQNLTRTGLAANHRERQLLYDTYKYHGSHIGNFGRFSIFYSPGRVAVSYIRSMPI